MANTPVVVLDDTLTDIADAIRAKTGGAATMTPSEMPTQIASIPSGGSVGIPREVGANGAYRIPLQSFSFSLPADATDLGQYAFNYAFYYSGLVSADMGSLTAVSSDYALEEAFGGCRNLTSANFRSLARISGRSAFHNAFINCTGLTSIVFESLSNLSGREAFFHTFQGCNSLASADFRSLTTVSGLQAFSSTFYGCSSLTSVNFSALTTVTGNQAFYLTFQYCSSLTSVNFSALTTVTGNQAFSSTFQNCTALTSLSFPALTASSFGSYTNQFNNMLQTCSDVTVHFPAAIQSTIENWTSVQNGFGGTNTTVLFDL